ncbi:MAG: hypothetical protein JWL90_157, partial [Chthoniobacteraceae bacterium]|nr:hypothetical protein [Chthoniobacteraceae bacterium]
MGLNKVVSGVPESKLQKLPMKTTLTAVLVLSVAAFAQDAGVKNIRPDETAGKPSEAKLDGEQKEAAIVLHRDDVLQDRGGGKHLWPL